MKISLIFFERGLETFFGVKPENYNLYFCSSADGNNKTSHLLKSLMSSGSGIWISTDDGLGGIITLEKQLEVSGKAEKWFIEKMKEFEFLNGYHGTNS